MSENKKWLLDLWKEKGWIAMSLEKVKFDYEITFFRYKQAYEIYQKFYRHKGGK